MSKLSRTPPWLKATKRRSPEILIEESSSRRKENSGPSSEPVKDPTSQSLFKPIKFSNASFFKAHVNQAESLLTEANRIRNFDKYDVRLDQFIENLKQFEEDLHNPPDTLEEEWYIRLTITIRCLRDCIVALVKKKELLEKKMVAPHSEPSKKESIQRREPNRKSSKILDEHRRPSPPRVSFEERSHPVAPRISEYRETEYSRDDSERPVFHNRKRPPSNNEVERPRKRIHLSRENGHSSTHAHKNSKSYHNSNGQSSPPRRNSRRSHSPVQQFPSSARRSPSPMRRYPSPMRQPPSPTRRYPPYTRQSPSPRRLPPLMRHSPSPRRLPPLIRQSPSPGRRYPLHPQRPPSPARRSPQPMHRSPSPTRRYSTHTRRPPSPPRRSPIHQRPSPTRRYFTHTGRPSPPRRSPYPTHRSPSPTRRYPMHMQPLSPPRRSPLPNDRPSPSRRLYPRRSHSPPRRSPSFMHRRPSPARRYHSHSRHSPLPPRSPSPMYMLHAVEEPMQPRPFRPMMELAPIDRVPREIFNARRKPLATCYFCGHAHWSHLCMKVNTLEARRDFYMNYNLCFNCGKDHRGKKCRITDNLCKWPHCAAVGEHHSALCTEAPYPITFEIVTDYLDYLTGGRKIYYPKTWDN